MTTTVSCSECLVFVCVRVRLYACVYVPPTPPRAAPLLADEDFDGEAAEAAAAAAKKRPAPPRKASGPSKRSKRGDEGSDESAGELPSEEASADEDDDDDDDDSDSDSDSDDEGE